MHEYSKILEVLKYKSFFYSNSEIVFITKIPKSTVYRWIDTYYNNYKKLNERYNKQHNDKISSFISSLSTQFFDFVLDYIKKNPFVIHKQLVSLLNIEFKFNINISKIKYILKHVGITKKNCKRRVVKNQNFLKEIIEKRTKFLNFIKSQIIDLIVSIDETGINSFFTSNLKGYSLKGETINLPVSEMKITNTSLLIAVTTKGIVNYKMSLGSTGHVIYNDFIETTIKKLNGNNYLFIFDNVSFHNNEVILKKITDSKNNFMFLPPYSPDLNPVENVNSIIKQDIHKSILAEYITGNLHTKIKEEHTKEVIENKKYNSLMVSNEMKNLKITVDNFKNIIKNETKNSIREQTINIKKNNEDKLIICNKVNEMKKTEKTKMKNCINLKITDEKLKTKIRIKQNKKHCTTLIKSFIDSSINNFNNNYDKGRIELIFTRAFTYDFTKIHNELKDRIVFLKS